MLEDGTFVVAHGRSGAVDEGNVFFAVFRFENGQIVEQWRFTAPAAPRNESGHTQTDGPTKPDGRQDTGTVRSVVRDYYETVHIGGKHDQVGR